MLDPDTNTRKMNKNIFTKGKKKMKKKEKKNKIQEHEEETEKEKGEKKRRKKRKRGPKSFFFPSPPPHPKKLIFHMRTVKRNLNEIEAPKKSDFEHPTKEIENERK